MAWCNSGLKINEHNSLACSFCFQFTPRNDSLRNINFVVCSCISTCAYVLKRQKGNSLDHVVCIKKKKLHNKLKRSIQIELRPNLLSYGLKKTIMLIWQTFSPLISSSWWCFFQEMSQSEFEAITCQMLKARENAFTKQVICGRWKSGAKIKITQKQIYKFHLLHNDSQLSPNTYIHT